MGTYTDRYGRYHDKPTNGVDPSSGNGFIYTAYALHLGLPVDIKSVYECSKLCSYHTEVFNMDRSPGQPEPPISKDELVGCAALGVLDIDALKRSKYSFYNPLGLVIPFSTSTLPAFFNLRNKHRNVVWKDGVYDAFPLAYRLYGEDRHYVRCKMDDSYKGLPRFLGALVFLLLNFISLSRKNHYSGFNLAMLELEDLYGHTGIFKLLYKKFYAKKHLRSYIKYFGREHLFTKRLRDLIRMREV